MGFGVVVALACVGGCQKKTTESKPATTAAAGSYLTVGTYCDEFCGELCGTCGPVDCVHTCKPRCLFNRPPDMVMDGKDPKTALAITQKELDACLATITSDSCPKIASGDVPAVCHTIQH
jgi:hypothetical protein